MQPVIPLSLTQIVPECRTDRHFQVGEEPTWTASTDAIMTRLFQVLFCQGTRPTQIFLVLLIPSQASLLTG